MPAATIANIATTATTAYGGTCSSPRPNQNALGPADWRKFTRQVAHVNGCSMVRSFTTTTTATGAWRKGAVVTRQELLVQYAALCSTNPQAWASEE
mmetsp:Transcript_24989/g.41661  ORF Transcript_24989/g.41661 Transcript_24989/m.41661 type:complete len:96 (+) Transcript_24989:154-441(+)